MAKDIIGYDLNEKYCQISFYSEEQQEPQTMETTLDNYQIPLVIGKANENWLIGNDAKRLNVVQQGFVAENLYQ